MRQISQNGSAFLLSYILSTSECEYLDGECRDKIRCEMDEVDFAAFGGTLGGKEVARDDDNDKVACAVLSGYTPQNEWTETH